MGSATQSHVAAGLSVFAGIWKNWCDPPTGKWERTFAVVTVPANELVTQIHDRMLAILPNDRFARG
jgi:putative SOS response-associated peptidase YedK